MQLSSVTRLLAAATAAAMLAFGVFLFLERKPVPIDTDSVGVPGNEDASDSLVPIAPARTSIVRYDDPDIEFSGDLSEIEILEQERWKISRGFITDETRYLTRLSVAELDMMIEQGSTHAMRIRGARLLNNPRKMFQLFEDAIVLGDIPALLTAASVWPYHGVNSGAELLAVSDDPAVNMLAIMLAAQLRGDNLLTPEWKDRLMTDAGLTEAQVAEACSASHALLEQLESERARRGLPPFDNDPSPHGEYWRGLSPISSTCN